MRRIASVNSKKNGFHLGYGWCGGPCCWGTKLKTTALDGLALDAEVHYVGIAADETARLKELQVQILMPMKPYSRKGVPYGNVFDLERVFEQEIQAKKTAVLQREKGDSIADKHGRHHLHIELTPVQYQRLVNQAKQCGLSRRAYLVRLIEGTPVRVRPSQEIKELRTEVHHIGNNINQIAKK